jgi:hypothetical protein
MDYKLDGNKLISRGAKIGHVEGNTVRDGHSGKVGTIDGRYIRDAHGSKVAEFDGENIRDSHGARISTMHDIRKVIDGQGGITLVALWLFFVR